jgi:CHAD domain-containing protein
VTTTTMTMTTTTTTTQSAMPAPPLSGLALHMSEVRALHAQALSASLVDRAGVELVHDLRVAIRRCRSLAQGLAVVDPGCRNMWRRLSRTGRPLFAGLGALRDAQVMRQWVADLVPGDDSAAPIATIDAAVVGLVTGAIDAVAAFDTSAWDDLAVLAPSRANVMLQKRPVLMWLALVRFQEARALHITAMRRRQPEHLHAVRIGVKRLRYTLESLLPERHAGVAKVLKRMQDVLGELHDLDVVLASLGTAEASVRLGVEAARLERLLSYKAMATGRQSVWSKVRAALPFDQATLDRCRRAYVLEVADSLGVDGHRARRAERAALALARSQRTTLLPAQRLATLLAPAARPRRARRAARHLLGCSDELRHAIRHAMRRDPMVIAAAVVAVGHGPTPRRR